MAMLEGTLSKWTNVMKGWQYRWFVLDENAGLLSYYTSKEKMMKGVRRGCVRLKGAVIGIDDQEDNTFTITVDHKTFHFQARDTDEREKWVRRLEDTISRHAYRTRLWESQNCYSGINNQLSTNRANHLQVLDRRISEADAYLQLMIEQSNKIDNRISELKDPDEKATCKTIQENANAMLDHIKHSIVTLQIAKNMAHPINGIYHGPNLSSKTGNIMELVHDGEAPITLVVPDTSYSSSEGEDDFYDANDDPFGNLHNSSTTRPFTSDTSNSNNPAAGTGNASGTTSGRSRNTSDETQLPDNARRSNDGRRTNATGGGAQNNIDNDLDYDALYEDESDSDLSMETHGSVVSHLLSQVKIGMDLTKVVLPTFILERRSLLEMYADYFAHPDLFLKIADLDDPRDRIVQVCRWYLSSYHAGRKSSVAKKPYNPILGEIFKCHWNIPGTNSTSEIVSDGPVPWCTRNQLTFIAEQVSHHPPISAFYAEHYNKKISFSAHVWTKSKFLGLSIGVHNIGQGIVKLCDRNEEYTLTFPNGYGRSILTVPWIELGGSVTIYCAQTGYNANIEFLTKPFYGGKRNKITADIFAPNEKKPFLSIAGEWSGLMEAKWNDGNQNKTEVFIDVNRIPIHKKQVKPIAEQTELESRRVWKEVTAGLKLNNIERATNAKCAIEQKQRDEVNLRQLDNSSWNHLHFTSVGDAWFYKEPLCERLQSHNQHTKR